MKQNSLFLSHPKFTTVNLMAYAKRKNGEGDFFLELLQKIFENLKEEDFIVEKGELYNERSLAKASGKVILQLRKLMHLYNEPLENPYLVSSSIAIMDNENIYIFTVGETACYYKKENEMFKTAFVLGSVKKYFGDFGYGYEFEHLKKKDIDELILCESLSLSGAVYTKEKVKINVA